MRHKGTNQPLDSRPDLPSYPTSPFLCLLSSLPLLPLYTRIAWCLPVLGVVVLVGCCSIGPRPRSPRPSCGSAPGTAAPRHSRYSRPARQRDTHKDSVESVRPQSKARRGRQSKSQLDPPALTPHHARPFYKVRWLFCNNWAP